MKYGQTAYWRSRRVSMAVEGRSESRNWNNGSTRSGIANQISCNINITNRKRGSKCRLWQQIDVTTDHTNMGYIYTGLFISPSGISDPCGTVAGMVTPKGNMSTEGQTLQVSVLPYRYSICAPLLTSEGSWQTFLANARQSRPMAPAGLFVSQCTGSHSAGISCTTHELFCP